MAEIMLKFACSVVLLFFVPDIHHNILLHMLP